jgi:methyl-accepting chemotaxis protein
MVAKPPSQSRFFSLLRRAGKSSKVSPATARTLDEGALWSAYDRALDRTRDAGAAAQRVSASLAQQRGAVDVLADRARAVAARAGEISSGFGRVVETFDRLSLVALNAGLEGARLGETAGRALLFVSDEIRGQAARGSEAARDVASVLAQVGSELAQLDAYTAQARDTSAEVTEDAARAAGASSDAEGAILEIGERLKKTTGSDRETVRALGEATERARALAASLSALAGKVPRGLLASALRPALEPVARMLVDDETGPGDDEERAE